MADSALLEQLTALQVEARARGYELAFRWLGKAVAELMAETKPKAKRRRGRWVTLAATGQRVMLDARVVARALKEAGKGGDDEPWPR